MFGLLLLLLLPTPAAREWTAICPVLPTPGRYIITVFSPSRTWLSGFPAGCGRACVAAEAAVGEERRATDRD